MTNLEYIKTLNNATDIYSFLQKYYLQACIVDLDKSKPMLTRFKKGYTNGLAPCEQCKKEFWDREVSIL